MAQPITWQNVLGPSLADASRPLEAAQRTFSGLFDNLGTLLRDTETRMETGRNILKDRNADVLRDLYARAKTPEQIAAAQQQETMLRAQFGDMLRPGDVRGLDEQRMVNVRNQLKQGWEFDNAQRDQNEFGLINSIKAKLASNDPIIRAQGEREAMAAQVRDRAALVGAATTAQREGVRWDEEKKTFVRADEMHRDTLFDRKHQRGIEDGQLKVSQGQLSNAQANTRLSERRFNLEVTKEMEDVAARASQQQAALTEKIGKVASYSSTSREGAETISQEKAKYAKDPEMYDMASQLVAKMQKEGASTGMVITALNALRPDNWHTFESTIIDDAYKVGMSAGPSSEEQAKRAKYQIGKLVEQGDSVNADARNLTQRLNGMLTQGAAPVVAARSGRGWANGGYPIENVTDAEAAAAVAEIEERVKKQYGAPAPQAAAAPAPQLNPVQQAEANLRAAMAAATGKGYYSPEAVAQRQAQSALEDAQEEQADLNEEQADRVRKQETRLRTATARVEGAQKQADRFLADGRKVPDALAKKLEQFKRDQAILQERYKGR